MEFINSNKTFEDIKTWCKENDVYVKDNEHLYLLMGKDVAINGLICEKNTNKLICACQKKIIESQLDDIKAIIDNKKFDVEYCEDGTVVRLYNYNGNWYTATNKCINGKDSYWSSYKTFDEMFWEIFDINTLSNLNPMHTYVFILLHKDNRIVVKHKYNSLVYICGIDNITMEENYANIFKGAYDIDRPKYIKCDNYEELCQFMRTTNVTKRGVLVKVDNQIYKLDYSDYSKVKSVRGNVPQIRMRYLELLNDPEMLNELEMYYQEYFFTFAVIRESLNRLAKSIYRTYIDSHVKHVIRVNEEHAYYRTLKQLHAQYKTTEKPITFNDVLSKLYSFDKHVIKTLLKWV